MASAARALPFVVLLLAVTLAPAAGATGDRVSFGQDRYTEHRGDVVAVSVSVPDGENATLTVDGNGYDADLTVDDDGDGTVALSWNTYDGSWSADGEDSVTLNDATEVNGAVPTGEYRLMVGTGDASNEAMLVLRERSLDRVGLWVANESASFDSAADVRAATETDRLSLFRETTPNSTFVVEVRGTGLGGAVAAANGSSVTDRVSGAFSGESVSLSIVQANPTPERKAKIVRLDGVTAAFVDEANDTYFLAVDPRNATVTYADDGAAELREGDRFGARVRIPDDSPLAPDGTAEEREMTPGEFRTGLRTHGDGRIRFQPAPDQTVTGTTAVGMGWNVTVRLTDGDGDPLRERTATVRENDGPGYLDGRFTASFDLRNVSSGTDVTVDVLFRGRSVLTDPVDGYVAEPTAALTVASTDTSGRFASVRADVSLARGGFVVLHEGSADGPVVGVSEHLPPGDHSVTVYVGEPTDADEVVAVAHRDENGNEWFDGPETDDPYERTDPDDGADISDWSPDEADRDVPDGDGSDVNESDGDEPNGSESATATATATEDPDESVSLPGFGVVEALVVLAAVAALATRRATAE